MIVTMKGWIGLLAMAGVTSAAVLGYAWVAAECGVLLGYLAGVRP